MTGRLKLVEPAKQASAEVAEVSFPDESATCRFDKQPALQTNDSRIEQDADAILNPRKSGKVSTIIKVTVALAFTVAALTAGYNAYEFFTTHEETDDATIAGHIHTVSPRVSGTVQEVLVTDNQHVKQGQVLFRLDPNDYIVQVAQAKAQLALANKQAEVAKSRIGEMSETAHAADSHASGNVDESTAALAHAKERVIDAHAGLASAKEHLVQATATLEKNILDYKRYAYLENQGAVSTQLLDSAKRDLSVSQASQRSAKEGIIQAEARLAAAQHDVMAAEAHVTTSRSEVHKAKASKVQTDTARKEYEAQLAAVEQAQAKLQDALLQESYTKIVAPVSGTIGRKTVEVGQRLQPSQQVLAIVPDDVWVVANFKETQLEKMHAGQPVEIKIDAFPHHPFKGRIDSVSPASGSQFALLPPDNATGNFTKIVQRVPVKIIFDGNSTRGYSDRLAPGMSVIATVETTH